MQPLEITEVPRLQLVRRARGYRCLELGQGFALGERGKVVRGQRWREIATAGAVDAVEDEGIGGWRVAHLVVLL